VKEKTSKFNYAYSDGVEFLYKFMSFKEGRLNEASDILRDQKIFLPYPDMLNDPFECKPHFSISEGPKGLHKFRKRVLKLGRQSGQTKKEATKMFTTYVSSRTPDQINEELSETSHKTFKEIQICSLTRSWNNLLFWAHYADSHKGFCCEYDAKMSPFSEAFRVEYSNDYPTITYPVDGSDVDKHLALMLIKSMDWRYENEYRIVSVPNTKLQPRNDGKYLLLNGNELKTIYLGVNIDPDNKEFLIDQVKQGNQRPEILQCKLHKKSFKLDVDEVKY
tara:strand:- start:21701 stop:22531 length:831 start_codon:yes stop_codon:yes gene_type:complete